MALSFVVTGVFFSEASAKSKTYVYRQRADWVKLKKLTKKQLGSTLLSHPYDINVPQLEAMLLSLTLNKGVLFKKETKEIGIFSEDEAQKFAPYIVDALKQADPNQVVNISIVHKRPHFIIRSDFISIINVFATDEGLHFHFGKLFAKLDGDYEQASKMDQAIHRAKGVRVSLKIMPGQKLAYSGEEVILDPNFDYGAGSILPREQPTKSANEILMGDRRKSKSKRIYPAPASQDVKSRLEKLEELKREKLITESEYNQKKKEILQSL